MFNYRMGKKILLVDDDLELSAVLREKLECSDCQVQVCDNGREVMEAIESYGPDLLLMDVMLPGLDGYTLATRISADEKLNRLPIVIMSALPTSQFMFESIPQVKAFFAKPFSTEDLIASIKSALQNQP